MANWQEQSETIHRWFATEYPAIGIGKPTEVFFLALALGGEVGELQNIIKKVWRGDSDVTARRNEIASEIADIRIYLEHLARALNIDIDEACEAKVQENARRWPAAAAGWHR